MRWLICRPKKCFTHPVVYATDRSKAVILVLFLFCVALCVLLRGVSYWDYLLSFFFSVLFSIGITSLTEEGAGLCASRAFVRLFSTRQCLSFFFSLLVSGVGGGSWLWHALDFSINFLTLKYTLTITLACTGEFNGYFPMMKCDVA